MMMERNIQLFSDNHPLIIAPLIHPQTGARRALQPINADEQAIDIGVMSLANRQEQFLAIGCGLFDSLVETEPDSAHEVPISYRLRPIGMPRTPYKSFHSTSSISAPFTLVDVPFIPIPPSKPLQPSTPVKSATFFGCSGCQMALFDVIPDVLDASTSSNSSHIEFPSPPKSSDTTPHTSPLQTSRKAPSVSDIRAHSTSLGSDTESSMIPLPAAPLPCQRTPRASPPPAVPSSSVQTPASRQLQINSTCSLIMRTVCYHMMTTMTNRIISNHLERFIKLNEDWTY